MPLWRLACPGSFLEESEVEEITSVFDTRHREICGDVALTRRTRGGDLAPGDLPLFERVSRGVGRWRAVPFS